MYKGFWLGNPKERGNSGDPGVDGTIILRWIFQRWDAGLWTGSVCFGIGTGGGLM